MVPGSTLMYGSNFCSATLYPWSSRRRAIDAAASPFPSEDTTPPVTKMNFTGRLSVCWVIPPLCASIRRANRHQLAHALQVFGCIDFDRLDVGEHHVNAVAVFECPQLLERFGQLERRGRQRGERRHKRAAVRVQANVFERGTARHIRVANVRNRRRGKIEGVAATVADDF